jgi:hypothetical protein
LKRLKKAIETFLWSGFIYKIDRRQLCFSPEKEGFAKNESVILEDQSF